MSEVKQQDPRNRIWKGKCRSCGEEISGTQKDLNILYDRGDGPVARIACTNKKCSLTVYLHPTWDFV
jgi:hypothetical protein